MLYDQATIKLNKLSAEIKWSTGSCGNAGCKDETCVCGLCRDPIGVSEEDARWEKHDIHCCGCELCTDQVPMILFSGEGPNMKQAAFHDKCFKRLLS